jgi:hypothetical protein
MNHKRHSTRTPEMHQVTSRQRLIRLQMAKSHPAIISSQQQHHRNLMHPQFLNLLRRPQRRPPRSRLTS